MKQVEEMSTEELQQELARRTKEEKQKRDDAKAAYEANRDAKVKILIDQASQYNKMLVAFKTGVQRIMNEQQDQLNEYGGIRANSKGGFSITSSDGTMRVTRTRTTKPIWDERSEKAVSLIAEFLRDTVKKKDVKVFDVLMSFIARDKDGNLEYDKVMNLLQHEDKWNDDRWIEGLTLIKESYRLDQTGFGYDFQIKNQEGKWERIELSFPSIKVQSTIEENETV